MIGTAPFDVLNQPTGLQGIVGAAEASAKLRKVFVPLQFWFCRNVGLALPLIALQYHEVKINLTFQTIANLTLAEAGTVTGQTTTSLTASLWADYIYLDTDERRRFAQVSHEYLIEQLQFNGDSTYNATTGTTEGTQTIDLTFNHPVKELVWVSRRTALTDGTTHYNQWSNYTDTAAVPKAPIGLTITFADGADDAITADGATATINNLVSYVALQSVKNPTDPITATGSAHNITQAAKLKLNGHDRFATRDGRYFNELQPKHHHTSVPESPGINVYSFALKPEDHQPSGTCNFSRIDNAQLILTIGGIKAVTAGVTKVFATNYNVLRIMSGMGGLAYSN